MMKKTLLGTLMFCVASVTIQCPSRAPTSSSQPTTKAVTAWDILHDGQHVVIWHQPLYNDPEPFVTAASSGVFTHVIAQGLHEADGMRTADLDHLETIRVAAKAANVRVIWTRWAWPGYQFAAMPDDAVFDPAYYERLIRSLKQEATEYGFDETCLNVEAYNHPFIKSLTRRNLTDAEFALIEAAVQEAVARVGQVDYILPAPLPYPRHTGYAINLLTAVQGLACRSISEHTYYDSTSRNDCGNCRNYDVFGAFVKVDPVRPESPTAPYFAPLDLLQQYEKWSHSDGLYVYPGNDDNAAEVARAFVDAAAVLKD